MINVLVPRRKRKIFDEYLGHWGLGVAPFMQLHCYEDLPDATALPGGTWLFTDVDELRPAPLTLACTLRDLLMSAGVQVLNDPRAVLLRRPLLEMLHAEGLNRFRVFEARGDLSALRFPVFVRRASEHTGSLTPLLHDRVELFRSLVRLRLSGEPADDLLVVEFLDTSDGDGLFRKYGAFIVDGQVVARSLNRGTEWMVKHGTTEFDVDFQREELRYVEASPHAEELGRIARLARIDYGRIDYGLLNGAVQTWEINMCPTIGRGARPSSGKMPEAIRDMRDEVKRRFYTRFAEAWQRIDAPAVEKLAVTFSPEQRRAARDAFALPHTQQRAWLRLIRTVLRPIKPVLQTSIDRAVGMVVSRQSSREP